MEGMLLLLGGRHAPSVHRALHALSVLWLLLLDYISSFPACCIIRPATVESPRRHAMEQYKEDYVDVKHPEDDSYSFRSRQYCQ